MDTPTAALGLPSFVPSSLIVNYHLHFASEMWTLFSALPALVVEGFHPHELEGN